MGTRHLAVGVIALSGSLACGGAGSPAQPSVVALGGIPAGTLLTVIDGGTGAPITGATVAVGRPLTTGGSGQVALDSAAEVGSAVAIEAAGYLPRSTRLGPGDPRFALWPRRAGFDETFTREAVYSGVLDGKGALVRPTTPVYLRVAAELGPGGRAVAVEAAAQMTAATGGAIPYSVQDAPPAGAVVFDLRVDPGDAQLVSSPAAEAVTRIHLSAARITGGVIAFRSTDVFSPSLLLHEIGHTFGLAHPTQPGLMNALVDARRTSFSEAEALVIRLMLQRAPGNVFPDDDRAVAAASEGSRTVVVACAR